MVTRTSSPSNELPGKITGGLCASPIQLVEMDALSSFPASRYHSPATFPASTLKSPPVVFRRRARATKSSGRLEITVMGTSQPELTRPRAVDMAFHARRDSPPRADSITRDPRATGAQPMEQRSALQPAELAHVGRRRVRACGHSLRAAGSTHAATNHVNRQAPSFTTS
jgi:hypothetical protein